ncbi:LacI family DNA-binding transcriptional regulator [Coraliomargarita akajimensis]|uniref:Transcriptional regulator, LacI family n=1 Tax=Coraliomargarita akajimensis (strain DSM 45221 / IAM 15411 / JCM 23193 / KCTC 12865 / 04OKA010-24) TaxID=583355 RepID=D5ENQ0_CORAD|nr:LacI family DNA-binding transcriptional regulator [Coraliomargarita akajimensis]ADE53559.1 transcriptional regulator, LacI family [Coraliomargarita akajimensis DSM 45221]
MKNPTYKESTATLVEVAEAAGVSRQTASRILGTAAHKHKQATVDKVKAIAEQMGYRPNLLAKSIVSGRTFSIGVLVPQNNAGDGFFTQVSNGIQRALLDTNLLPIFLHTSDESPEKDQIHRLVDRRVDGMILIPQGTDVAPDYFKEIADRNIPVVCVNERITNVGPLDFVGTDETNGGKAAAQYLIAKGHTKLGCLHWSERSVNLGMRQNGFLKEAETRGASCTTIALPGWTLEENIDRLCQALQSKGRPTAFFCVSDVYAAMLYKAAEHCALRIPEDLSVLGFAGLPWGEFLSPGLSTLSQDGGRIGEEAAKALLNRINGSTNKPAPKRVKVELVERRSVAAI